MSAVSRVENPGEQMTSSSASGRGPRRSPPSQRPSSLAGAHTLAASIPRAVVLDLDHDTVAGRARAKRDRSVSGPCRPPRDRRASRCRGSPHCERDAATARASGRRRACRSRSPGRRTRDESSCSVSRAMSRIAKRMRSNTSPTATRRMRITPLANRSVLSLDRFVRVVHASHAGEEPDSVARATESPSRARVDDEIADHAHQIVQPRQVDPHDVRCRRRHVARRQLG